jgi:two-component system, cell cycle response regulator
MSIRQCALFGFNPFETMTLESFFKLAGRRPPGYAIMQESRRADVWIVNGEDAAKVQSLHREHPQAKAVVIGSSAHGTPWVALPRPIRLLSVLEEIEKLMSAVAVSAPAAVQAPMQSPARVSTAPALSAPPTASPAPRLHFSPTVAAAPSAVAAAPATKRSSNSAIFGNSLGFDVSRVDVNHEGARDDDDYILVVDDSNIVLRLMQGRLQRFGYSVALASSGEQAVEMAKSRYYKFVFLDVMMPGIDGYQTCRMIKSAKSGNPPPVIVMLSSRGGSIDKIRGTLAGADAYVTKPLAEAALIKVLADHDKQQAMHFSATRPVTRAR